MQVFKCIPKEKDVERDVEKERKKTAVISVLTCATTAVHRHSTIAKQKPKNLASSCVDRVQRHSICQRNRKEIEIEQIKTNKYDEKMMMMMIEIKTTARSNKHIITQ